MECQEDPRQEQGIIIIIIIIASEVSYLVGSMWSHVRLYIIMFNCMYRHSGPAGPGPTAVNDVNVQHANVRLNEVAQYKTACVESLPSLAQWCSIF